MIVYEQRAGAYEQDQNTTSIIKEDDQNGRRPKWKTTKMEDQQNVKNNGVEVKLEPNLTAGKQTVTPCHHGGWGSLDSISGKESDIRLCFIPLTD